MNPGLSFVSTTIATIALALAVLKRRAAGGNPVIRLFRDRFSTVGHLASSYVVLGSLAAAATVWVPVGLFGLLGWNRIEVVASAWLSALPLALLTLAVKVAFAAAEEFSLRGALFPLGTRLTGPVGGLVVQAALFSLGHLERTGARIPTVLTLLVHFLDGIGFALAFAATRCPWMPTAWHAGKNVWLWLAYSQSSLQWTLGWLGISHHGPVLWVGSQYQAGLVDLAVALVLAVVVLFRRRLREGLAWVAESW